MLRPECEIRFGDYIFTGAANVEINDSWEDLTSTATITIPRKLIYKGKDVVSGEAPLLKRGMKVDISIGYDGNLINRYNGYIRSISATVPLEIQCEDESYILKKGNIKKSYKNTTLKEVLKDNLSSIVIGSQPDRIGLGPFRINNATPAKILQHLKEEYLIPSWFRNRKLYIGLAYWPDLRKEHIIEFDKFELNNNLEYRQEDDISIFVRAINITTDNKKVEYEYGDKDGDTRTLHFYNRTKSDIDKLVKEELTRMKYTGYYGSFSFFGTPSINHGDVVNLKSISYPERDGKYLVKANNITYGVNGYRQSITLDVKVQ